jgi:hypothetical protein
MNSHLLQTIPADDFGNDGDIAVIDGRWFGPKQDGKWPDEAIKMFLALRNHRDQPIAHCNRLPDSVDELKSVVSMVIDDDEFRSDLLRRIDGAARPNIEFAITLGDWKMVFSKKHESDRSWEAYFVETDPGRRKVS